MDRDTFYIDEEIPYEMRDMATFVLCFHLSPLDLANLEAI